MLYSDYVNEHLARGSWPRIGKVRLHELMTAAGIPMPRHFVPGSDVIIKPDWASDRTGCQILAADQWVIQEALIDIDGTCPPRDIRCLCFNGKIKVINVTRVNAKADGRLGVSTASTYLLLPSWEEFNPFDPGPWGDRLRCNLDGLAEALPEIQELCYRIQQLDCLGTERTAMRLDFMLSTQGVKFIEYTMTWGTFWRRQSIPENCLVTPEWDARIGAMTADAIGRE